MKNSVLIGDDDSIRQSRLAWIAEELKGYLAFPYACFLILFGQGDRSGYNEGLDHYDREI